MSLNLEQANGGTFVLSKAGLSVGTTNTQLSTAAITTSVVNGVFQAAKAITASFAATMSAGLVAQSVPIGSKCSWGVWLDSAGNFTVSQGLISPVNSNADKVAPPAMVADKALVGVFTTYAATAAFVLGTNVLTAGLNAGVNVTYFDTFSYPAIGF